VAPGGDSVKRIDTLCTTRCARILLFLGLALGPVGFAAAAVEIDWTALATPDVVEIITQDENGDDRETKIWIAVVDDAAYIRTGNSRWFENLERNPAAVLRSDDTLQPVLVEQVEDVELFARVEMALREKYGFSDRMVGIFRPSDRHVMLLVAR
jgi:hypothetical protein